MRMREASLLFQRLASSPKHPTPRQGSTRIHRQNLESPEHAPHFEKCKIAN